MVFPLEKVKNLKVALFFLVVKIDRPRAAAKSGDGGHFFLTHFHWSDRNDLQTRAGDPAACCAAIVAPKERFYRRYRENRENPVHGIPGTGK